MNDFNCCESVNTNTSKAEQDASIALGLIVALTELGKSNEKIKELNAEIFKLKES